MRFLKNLFGGNAKNLNEEALKQTWHAANEMYAFNWATAQDNYAYHQEHVAASKMNEIEKYEFDRMGYLVIKNLLKVEQVNNLLFSINLLERHAIQNLKKPPRNTSPWGPEYHFNETKGYHAQGENKDGGSIIIEDFWNADSIFDSIP